MYTMQTNLPTEIENSKNTVHVQSFNFWFPAAIFFFFALFILISFQENMA